MRAEVEGTTKHFKGRESGALGELAGVVVIFVSIYERPIAFCSKHDENRAFDDG